MRVKILITGGNGFIGSHLVNALLESGHTVHIISRNASKVNITNSSLQYFTGDYGNASLLSNALKDVDVVFHLAYTTVPENSTLNPAMDIETNVIPTLNFL